MKMTTTKVLVITLITNIIIFPIVVVVSIILSNKIYFEILGKTGNNDLLGSSSVLFLILVFILLNTLLIFIFSRSKFEDPSVSDVANGESKPLIMNNAKKAKIILGGVLTVVLSVVTVFFLLGFLLMLYASTSIT